MADMGQMCANLMHSSGFNNNTQETKIPDLFHRLVVGDGPFSLVLGDFRLGSALTAVDTVEIAGNLAFARSGNAFHKSEITFGKGTIAHRRGEPSQALARLGD